jgi:hypothetical protein
MRVGNRSPSLTDSLNRQDLNAALMTGSIRNFDHNSFPELSWRRYDPLEGTYVTPQAFLELRRFLCDDFNIILEDICGLKAACESADIIVRDPKTTLLIDNCQASIESRLLYCREASCGTEDIVLYCCITAAYLCTYALYTEVWHASLIPSYCSVQLLGKLQAIDIHEPPWVECRSLLTWLVTIGGMFAPTTGETRVAYMNLLLSINQDNEKTLTSSWDSLLRIVGRFIWSNEFFDKPGKAFWEDCCRIGISSSAGVS